MLVRFKTSKSVLVIVMGLGLCKSRTHLNAKIKWRNGRGEQVLFYKG